MVRNAFVVLFLAGAAAFAGAKSEDGIVYGEAGGEKLTMDYYPPAGPAPHPIAIVIHGGVAGIAYADAAYDIFSSLPVMKRFAETYNLRALYGRFDSWPLALAAYNCGETRIAALLKKNQASRFAEISAQLPAETRMYVPKVLATFAVRENAPLEKWAPSRVRAPASAGND